MIVGPCTVVTGRAEPGVLQGVGVRVVGAHIAQVGPLGSIAAAHPDETLWPARGRVLMPGLVNTHAHLARHLARGLSIASAREWQRYESVLSAEDVYWSVMAGLVEGVRHGVTTVCDFHRSGACLDLSLSEVVGAARKLGVRLAACYGAAESDAPQSRRAAVDECLGFAGELTRRREGRLRAMVGVQAVTLDGVERLLREALERAGDELAVHLDLELDLTPAERWGAQRPWREGVLPNLWAHAERAPRGLLGVVQERGDGLCAVGAGSVAALAREAEVGWGSGSGVNAPPLADGGHGWAPGVGADCHYRRLFVNGARWAASHFGERLGVIEPGAPADLLLVDYSPATEFTARTVLAHLCSGLLRAPVSGVMVAGRVLMDNGVLVAVDEHEVAERARECAERVWSRLG